MTNEAFAAEVVKRLNILIESDDALDVMESLLAIRLTSARWHSLADHPSIQVSKEGDFVTVGIIGMLNGMIGTIPDGPRATWGYLAACYENARLLKFKVIS